MVTRYLGFALVLMAALSAPRSLALTETVLGNVKAVQIKETVTFDACKANFKQKESSSLCVVKVFELKDTDLFLANSEAVKISHEMSGGKVLKGEIITNVRGFYFLSFLRLNENGSSKGISLSEATPPRTGCCFLGIAKQRC